MYEKSKEISNEVKSTCLNCENVRIIKKIDDKKGRVRMYGMCSLYKIEISDYHLHTTKCNKFVIKVKRSEENEKIV